MSIIPLEHGISMNARDALSSMDNFILYILSDCKETNHEIYLCEP